MAGVIASREFNDQLVRVVKQVLREDRGAERSAGTTNDRRIRRHQGILLDNVTAVSNPLGTPNYGTVRVVKQVSGTETLAVTNLCLEVAYRFTEPNLNAGAFCKIEFLDGEWSFYAVDCQDSGLSTAGCT